MADKKFSTANKQDLIDFIDMYKKDIQKLISDTGLKPSAIEKLYRISEMTLLTYNFTNILELYKNPNPDIENLRNIVRDYYNKRISKKDFCLKYKIRYSTNLSTNVRKISEQIGEPIAEKRSTNKIVITERDREKIYKAYLKNLKLCNGDVSAATVLTIPRLYKYYQKQPRGARSIIKRIIADFGKNNDIGVMTLQKIKRLSNETLMEIYKDYTTLRITEFCTKYNTVSGTAYTYNRYIKKRLGIA